MGDELMQTMQEVDATPRLIVECMTSTLAGRRFAFTAAELHKGVLLGRASDCHVRFDPSKDLKVSGHHALIDDRDGKITVRDQGSSNGLFLNDVRVPGGGGAVVISGSKLSLGQEGAILKLLVPGQAQPKTAPAIAPAQPAASAPPAASAAPAAKPITAAPVPAAPRASSDSARRGMPSVQTDPALIANKEPSASPSAGNEKPRLLKEVAEPAQAPRKGGSMVTLVGAIVLLLLAAGALAAWYVMEQQKKEEGQKSHDEGAAARRWRSL